MTANSDAPANVTVQVAAEWLGITGERVRQLIKAGYIVQPTKRTVDLKSAVQGYIRHLKEEDRRSTKSASASRVQDARAKEIEVRTARELGELVPKEEAAAFMQAAIGQFTAGLNGLAAQVSRDPHERNRIETAIDAIREKMAQAIGEFGDGYAGLGDDDSPGTEDAAGPMGRLQ